MVRETRYLYVGNLPNSITEANILEHFSNYGKIQSVRMVPPIEDRPNAIIAFMDIKCAAKAHKELIVIEGESVVTAYNESSTIVTLTSPIQPSNITNILNEIEKTTSENNQSEERNERNEKKLASIVQIPEQSALSSSESTGVDPNDNRPLAMLMKGFPTRSTDTSIRDGLFHEYKKFGKVMAVQVIGQGDERHAIVCFKKAEDAAKALESSSDKKFFGSKVQVFPHEGYGNRIDIRGPDDHDELHHKATRTLFVGNLNKLTTKEFLADYFEKYGHIIDIDVKNQGDTSTYAFIQYDNIKSVVKALRELDDEYINDCKVKVGFGKSLPTTCLWLGGIPESVSEKWLAIQHLINFGHLLALYIDRVSGRGLAYYETIEQAIAAVQEMKTRVILDRKLEVDFASRDCQNQLLDAMECSGQLRPSDRPEERIGRPPIYIHPSEILRPPRPSFDGIHPRSRFYGPHEYLHPRSSFRPHFFHGHPRGYFKKIDPYEPVYDPRELPALPKYYEPPSRAVDDSYENYHAYTRDNYANEPRHSLSPEKSFYNISSHHSIGADSPRSSGRYQSPVRSSKTSLERDEREYHREDKHLKQLPYKKRSKINQDSSQRETDSKYKKNHLSHLSHRNNSISSRSNCRSSLGNKSSHRRLSDSDKRHYIELSEGSISPNDEYEDENDYDEPENDEVLDLEKKKRQLLEMLQAMEEDPAQPAAAVAAEASSATTCEPDDGSTGSDVEIVEKPSSSNSTAVRQEDGDNLQQKIDLIMEDKNVTVYSSKQSSPNIDVNHRANKLSEYHSDEVDDDGEKSTKSRKLKERHYRKRQFSHSSSNGSLHHLEAYSPAHSAASEELLPPLRKEEVCSIPQHEDYIKSIPCSPNNEMLIDPRPPPMTIIIGEYMNLPLPDFAFDLQAMRRRFKEKNKSDENDEEYANNLLDENNQNPITLTSEVVPKLSKSSTEVNPAQIDEEIRGFIKDSHSETDVHCRTSPAISKTLSDDSAEIKEKNDNGLEDNLLKNKDEKSNIIINKPKKEDNFNNLENLSLEERIKALDEKLNMIQQGSSRISCLSLSTTSVSDPIQSTIATSVLDYREKYRRHRRDPSSLVVPTEQKVSEPSDLAKTLLSRSSVFDQDTKRLEMLNKLKQESSNLSLDDIHRNNVDYSTLRTMFPLSITTSWSSTLNISQPLSPAPTANLYPTVTPGGVVWNTLPTPITPLPLPQQKPYLPSDINKFQYAQTQSLQGPLTNNNPMINNVQISDPRKLARSMNNSEFIATPNRKSSDTTISPQVIQPNNNFISSSYPSHISTDSSYKSENLITQKSKEVTSPLVSILKKQSSRDETSVATTTTVAVTKSNSDSNQNIEMANIKKRTDSISSNSDKPISSTNISVTKSNNSLSNKLSEDSTNKKDTVQVAESRAKLSINPKLASIKIGEKLFEKNMSKSVVKNKSIIAKSDNINKDIFNKTNDEVQLNINEKLKKKETKDINLININIDFETSQNIDDKQKEKSKSTKQNKNENKYKRIKMDTSEDNETIPALKPEKESLEKNSKTKVINNSNKYKLENTNKTITSKKEPSKIIDDSKHQPVIKIDKKSDIDKSNLKNEIDSKTIFESESQVKYNSIKNKIITNEIKNLNHNKVKHESDNKLKVDVDNKLKNGVDDDNESKIETSKKETSNKNKDEYKKPKNQSNLKQKLENGGKFMKKESNPIIHKDKNFKEIVEITNAKKSAKESDSKNKPSDSTKKSVNRSSKKEDNEDERQKELQMIAEALGEDISQYISMYDMVKRRSCKDTAKSNDEVKNLNKQKSIICPKHLTSISSESDAFSHTSESNKKQQKKSKMKAHLTTSSSSLELSSDGEQAIAIPTKKAKKNRTTSLSKQPSKIKEDLSSSSTSSSEDDEFILKSSMKVNDQTNKSHVKNKTPPQLQQQQRAKIYTSSSSSDEAESHKIETKATSSSATKETSDNVEISKSKKNNKKLPSTKSNSKSQDLKKEITSSYLLEDSIISEASVIEIKPKTNEVSKNKKNPKIIIPIEKINKNEKLQIEKSQIEKPQVEKPQIEKSQIKSKSEEIKDILKSIPNLDADSILKKQNVKNNAITDLSVTKDKTKSFISSSVKKNSLEINAINKIKSKVPKQELESRNIFEKMDFKDEAKSPAKFNKDSKHDITEAKSCEDLSNLDTKKKKVPTATLR